MKNFGDDRLRLTFTNSSSRASRRQFLKFAAIASTSAALDVTIRQIKAIANPVPLQTASNDLTVRMGVVGCPQLSS